MDVAVLMWGGTTDDPVLTALQRRGVADRARSRATPPRTSPSSGSRTGAARRSSPGTCSRWGTPGSASVTLPFDRPRRAGVVDPRAHGRSRLDPHPNRLDGVSDAGVEPVMIVETAGVARRGGSGGRARPALRRRPPDRVVAPVRPARRGRAARRPRARAPGPRGRLGGGLRRAGPAVARARRAHHRRPAARRQGRGHRARGRRSLLAGETPEPLYLRRRAAHRHDDGSPARLDRASSEA